MRRKTEQKPKKHLEAIVFVFATFLMCVVIFGYVLIMVEAKGAISSSEEKVKIYVQTSGVVLLAMGICISSYLVIEQLRAQRMANTLKVLSEMRREWTSDEMMKFRREVYDQYYLYSEKGHFPKQLSVAQAEVATFFEQMGLLVQDEVVPKRFVWELYDYYIDIYWRKLKPAICAFRKNFEKSERPEWFCNFQALDRDMNGKRVNYSECLKRKLDCAEYRDLGVALGIEKREEKKKDE